jgi:hypothetical protein
VKRMYLSNIRCLHPLVLQICVASLLVIMEGDACFMVTLPGVSVLMISKGITVTFSEKKVSLFELL